MDQSSAVIKKSISLSKVVSDWADGLAERKGFGTNFSAYIADLIRRDKEREEEIRIFAQGRDSSSMKRMAEGEIEQAIRETHPPKPRASRKK